LTSHAQKLGQLLLKAFSTSVHGSQPILFYGEELDDSDGNIILNYLAFDLEHKLLAVCFIATGFVIASRLACMLTCSDSSCNNKIFHFFVSL